MKHYPVPFLSTLDTTQCSFRIILTSPLPIIAPIGSFSTSSVMSSETLHPSVTREVSHRLHIHIIKKREKRFRLYCPGGRKDFSHVLSSITGIIATSLFLKMALCINHPPAS